MCAMILPVLRWCVSVFPDSVRMRKAESHEGRTSVRLRDSLPHRRVGRGQRPIRRSRVFVSDASRNLLQCPMGMPVCASAMTEARC